MELLELGTDLLDSKLDLGVVPSESTSLSFLLPKTRLRKPPCAEVLRSVVPASLKAWTGRGLMIEWGLIAGNLEGTALEEAIKVCEGGAGLCVRKAREGS